MVKQLRWSPRAKQDLKDIHYWYKNISSRKVADRIINDIRTNCKLLCNFPFMGYVEPALTNYEQCFRTLVHVPNYKIVYWTEGKFVKIATIFDTRQAPEKMTSIIKNTTQWVCEENAEYETKAHTPLSSDKE